MLLNLFNWQQGMGEILKVRVTPKAATNRIKIDYLPDGSQLIRIYVTTPPEDGKANREVIKLLAKELSLSKSAFTIIQGLTSRDKIIKISR